MIYIAIAIALVVGFCFGLLTRALVSAAKRYPAGSAPRRLFLATDESAEEHLSNCLQILGGFAYLNAASRAGEDGLNCITAASNRVKSALAKLQQEGKAA